MVFITAFSTANAQSYTSVFDPHVDANAALLAALQRSTSSHKKVLVQIGGNWCHTCVQFHHYIECVDSLQNLLYAHFESVLVNTSPENYNLPLLARYGYPHHGGVPVFLILDEWGKLLITQHADDWVVGDTFDPRPISKFLRRWAVK